MNRWDHYREAVLLSDCITTIRDIAVGLQDAQSQMDNHGDIARSEAEITHLNLAADLIEKVIGKGFKP